MRVALAVLAAVSLFGPGLARAQGAGEAVALLELVIDGRPTAVVGHFVMRDGRPLASYADWQAYGVRAAGAGAASPAATALVGVDQLPGVHATVDAAAQALRIDQGPDLDNLTVIGQPPETAVPEIQQDSGALVNYDATVQHAAGRSTYGALVRARAFVAAAVLESAFVSSNATTTGSRRTVRLDTTLSTADPHSLRRLRAGDVVAGALGWTRPMRLFGAQAMTDFALRPDLVTAPTTLLSGTAAVPSTVDVLVNGVRQFSQPIEPGRFEVRQPPSVSGSGEVSVVVRDALGRETVQRLPFYAAASQLAAGVSSYSVEAGRIRRRFGVASADFGTWAGSASWRAGITDRFTTEAHIEGSGEAQQGGLGGRLAVPRVGAFNAHMALSHAKDVGGGWMVGVGAERQSGIFNVAAQFERAGRNYRDLAATQGDATYARSARVSAGVDLGRFGGLGMAWVQRDPIAAPEADPRPLASGATPALFLPTTSPGAGQGSVRLLTASYSVALAARVQGYVSAFRDIGSGSASGSASGSGSGAGGGTGVSVGILIPFGERGIVASSLSHDRGGARLNAQASQAALAPGEVGWQVQADQSVSGLSQSQQRAELSVLARAARLSAAVERAAGGTAVSASAQGAVIALGGGLHVSRAVNDSVALVDVPGAPGVGVYHQNRFVGRTDAQGQLVVPDLLAYQPNRVSIEPLDLPMEQQADRFQAEVRPGDRAGVIVRFAAEPTRLALLRLLDGAGAPLPLGTVITPRSGGPPTVVGYDGQTYIEFDPSQERLDARWHGAVLCSSQSFGSEPPVTRPPTARGAPREVVCR